MDPTDGTQALTGRRHRRQAGARPAQAGHDVLLLVDRGEDHVVATLGILGAAD
jgi:hypothetical protein